MKIYNYLLGWYRYYLYYSKILFRVNLTWLIRKHIKEQIEVRINTIKDTECYINGSCVECGCATTALQMANKSCEKDCYPEMLHAYGWSVLKSTQVNKAYVTLDGGGIWKINYEDKFEKMKFQNIK